MPPMSIEERRLVLASTLVLKTLGHSGFDRMLLELGLPEDVGAGSGLLARATSLGRYALSNPDAKAIDNRLLSAAIVDRARQEWDRGVRANLSHNEESEYEAALAGSVQSSPAASVKPVEAATTWTPTGPVHVHGDVHPPERFPGFRPASGKRPPARRKVFIVHGHDEAPRESVARFLEALNFEPVILHERPNRGRTIITKFQEEARDVGFAVVLMTPDDSGGKIGGDTASRPRQNVVFELGFFIGALGPERVVAMVKGQVEKPSDFDGVVYIPLDDGNWKLSLVRELAAAGYDIEKDLW